MFASHEYSKRSFGQDKHLRLPGTYASGCCGLPGAPSASATVGPGYRCLRGRRFGALPLVAWWVAVYLVEAWSMDSTMNWSGEKPPANVSNDNLNSTSQTRRSPPDQPKILGISPCPPDGCNPTQGVANVALCLLRFDAISESNYTSTERRVHRPDSAPDRVIHD
jgi:hypothetical protein